ncbi:nitrile hydratase regulator [Shewanella hanedai]|uniref:Transporter substrate-binding protein n=1 Tax=Shewanella hanedai TaxID=25 RepID=A0A553JSQ5_SHEHA|nr:substrate-binding domain-containing protein [Shewanella hanedai]TRY15496.1 transporter substrate-binding protein [Shewanella hanedai]GGI80243.1 nitrile hydratase regulator [Shewanella hanedai]
MNEKVSDQTVKIGVLLPFSGPIGLWGNSCEACSILAAAELNSYRGILDYKVELEFIDASVAPSAVAKEVSAKVHSGEISALVGTHTSDIRKEVAHAIRGRVPYIYTPMYEGGDQCTGMFLTGLTTEQSVLPTLEWLCINVKSQRWFFVGSDYVWPAKTHSSAIDFLHSRHRQVVANELLPLHCKDFSSTLDRIEQEKPDVVFINLLGEGSIDFNRQFAQRGLDTQIIRYCSAIEENMLYAIGNENSRNLFSSMGYFEGLDTNEAKSFNKLYYNNFGELAPGLNQISVSSYEGIMLLADLAERSQSLLTNDIEKTSMSAVNFHSPRGEITLLNKNVQADVFIVQAKDNGFVPLHRVGY